MMELVLGRVASAQSTTVLACLALGACATPGISYLSSVPAGDTAAASYRTVSVGYFSGPEGDWYTGAFETMLLTADFDGGPWFIVHDPGAPEGTYAGRYSGWIDLIDVDVDEYTRTKKKCVEWDGLFDCEHRAEVLQACIDVDVDVAVTTRLSDVGDGAIVFQETYHGRAGEHECDDIKIISGKHAGRREAGYGPFGHFHDRFGAPAGYLTHDLVREALADTLGDVRRDIAPFNARAKAPLVAEAIDPEAGADPRFASAVSAAEDGNTERSCGLWSSLVDAYPGAPGVRHNAGACAEAAGDLAAAQIHYATALDGMALFRRDGGTFDTLVAALNRISGLRQGNETLSRLGEANAVGGEPQGSTGLCQDCITPPDESLQNGDNASNPSDKAL